MPVAPRALAYVSRSLTGIEIHPAARSATALFIDHGMGVVIGETAEVGENVTIYQGVTLGGTGFATGKRHPTVEDNVTIGSGAKLLGPITIGHGAKIGANAVVIHDVPPNSTVVGNPGHPVRVEGRKPEGPDADWVHLPDPIADALKQLSRRIAELERELAALRAPSGERGRGRARCGPSADRSPPVASLLAPRRDPAPPADVFPWLLEEDKVPRWTGHLRALRAARRRPLGSRLARAPGARGERPLDRRRARGDRVRAAVGRADAFSTNGIEVVSSYALEAAGAGTRLTQSIEAKPSGLAASCST